MDHKFLLPLVIDHFNRVQTIRAPLTLRNIFVDAVTGQFSSWLLFETFRKTISVRSVLICHAGLVASWYFMQHCNVFVHPVS